MLTNPFTVFLRNVFLIIILGSCVAVPLLISRNIGDNAKKQIVSDISNVCPGASSITVKMSGILTPGVKSATWTMPDKKTLAWTKETNGITPTELNTNCIKYYDCIDDAGHLKCVPKKLN
jgi:hypothetical protein